MSWSHAVALIYQQLTTLKSASGLAQLNIVKRRVPEIYNVTVR